MKLAIAYRLAGDEHALDELVKQHPQAAVVRGDLYASERQWEKAIATYGKLITVETANTALLTKRAEAYIATERHHEARKVLRRAASTRQNGSLSENLDKAIESIRESRVKAAHDYMEEADTQTETSRATDE